MKPPKNKRRVVPRCCLTCVYRKEILYTKNDYDHSTMQCIRDGMPSEDEPEYYVCDGYKRNLKVWD